jgi:hypothetical protein
MTQKFMVPQIALLSLATLAFSASPALAGYGTSPAAASAPTCDNTAPAKPSFSFVRKAGASEIEIGWNATDKATKWTVAYGPEKGKYIYGLSDFGDENSRSVKISMLPQGVYYVVVKANNGCKPGPFSDERKVTVTAGGQVLGARTFRPFTGNVLGVKTAASPAPEVTTAPSASVTSAPVATAPQAETAEKLNWFQRLVRFFTGK